MKKLVTFLALSTLAFFSILYAQSPIPDLGPVFDNSVIPRVDIQIAEDDLEALLAEGNEFSDFEYETVFIFNNGSTIDTLEQVGFRLRGNTSRTADKKSFKVSFNTYVPGRKFNGLEKLNINGEHNDPTVSRSRICWEILREIGVPGSRANHVELYINGDYYGLYANVEHVDEEFVKLRFGDNSGNLYKCLWPATLIYLGSNPDLYKFEQGGRRVYDLKTNTDTDDYSDLANFIDVIGNTPIADLPCELEQIFHVDSYLKSMAFEILIAHWDNYIVNKNNFYLYHNLKTGLFEYIPFDLDNTLGVSFFSNFDFTQQNIYNWKEGVSEARPLYTRLLLVPEYKDRFSFYVQEFLNGPLNSNTLFPKLDDMKLQIQDFVSNDPLFPLDYGFTLSDFSQNFEESIDYGFIPDGIKSHLEARTISANQQLILNDIAPFFTGTQHNFPGVDDNIIITADIFDDNQVQSVELHYIIGSQAAQITEMFDDGLHNDGAPDDGIYGVELLAAGEETIISYTIEATDNQNLSTTHPTCDSKYIYIGSSSLPLKLNEFMAANNNTIADEFGEYEDWIELHNYGTTAINLYGKYLTDDPSLPTKWPLPNIQIQAGAFLLFWADKDQDQGIMHTNFKLEKNGELIAIYDDADNNFAQIDLIEFGEQQADVATGRLPNGTGAWQIMDDATPGASNSPLDTQKLFNNKITLFPNPAKDQVRVEWSVENLVAVNWEITDMAGRNLRNGLLKPWNQRIDLSRLATGVYTIKFIKKNGDVIGKERLVVVR